MSGKQTRLLVTLLVAATQPPPARAADPPRLAMVGDVAAFAKSHCLACHGADKAAGGFDVEDLLRGPTVAASPAGSRGYTHEISTPAGQLGMARINRLRVGHVAHLLGKMRAVREADGSTLLDNALVHFGGGMGTWHESTDLANLVAGHGGGRFKLGEHVENKKAPLAGLYVTMLQAAGVPARRFADATEPLNLN